MFRGETGNVHGDRAGSLNLIIADRDPVTNMVIQARACSRAGWDVYKADSAMLDYMMRMYDGSIAEFEAIVNQALDQVYGHHV